MSFDHATLNRSSQFQLDIRQYAIKALNFLKTVSGQDVGRKLSLKSRSAPVMPSIIEDYVQPILNTINLAISHDLEFFISGKEQVLLEN